MKISTSFLFCTSLSAPSVFAFQVTPPRTTTGARTTTTALSGYLDDLSGAIYGEDPNPDLQAESKEATDMSKEQLDRYGPGNFEQFVDFHEFDGGDGQMGVAGDGGKGLEKEWEGAAQMAKSKVMSAKNAWGKSTGYADKLMEEGVEATRAQQMENWKNQQEVQEARNQQRWLTDEFDSKEDEDWRNLSNFVGEKLQDVDLDQEFGSVLPGDITGVIELQGRINSNQVHEFGLKNPFMGFSDFRARFTGMSNPAEWSVTPDEGSLNGRGDPTQFVVKFRPSSPSASTGYLVVETDEDKWTYQLMGSGSM